MLKCTMFKGSIMNIDCETGGESECCGATILNGLCSNCHEHAEGEEVPADIVDVAETSHNIPKCKCGADAVYHYCRICWCMEIDAQKNK